ncbi:hypothetical protein ACFSZS_24400 [Seohaeicola zhoushanensis]
MKATFEEIATRRSGKMVFIEKVAKTSAEARYPVISYQLPTIACPNPQKNGFQTAPAFAPSAEGLSLISSFTNVSALSKEAEEQRDRPKAGRLAGSRHFRPMTGT